MTWLMILALVLGSWGASRVIWHDDSVPQVLSGLAMAGVGWWAALSIAGSL